MTGEIETPIPDDIPAPTFDLSKKKKKKKPKAAPTDDGTIENGTNSVTNGLSDMKLGENGEAGAAPPEEEQPMDFALLDFGGKKKRKKKKVVFDDDLDADVPDATGEAGQADRQQRRDFPSQPWDNTDRDYTYKELTTRAFGFLHGKNPRLITTGSRRKKVTLQLPQVAREGTKKTVFLNFGAICKSIHRQQDHLLAYICAELGTNGNIQEAGRLVIKGRFGAEGIANVLKRYMLEYVICTSCRSSDTVLMRDANTRLYFVSCESCGAKRSVAPIKQGYMAQVERRKKK